MVRKLFLLNVDWSSCVRVDLRRVTCFPLRIESALGLSGMIFFVKAYARNDVQWSDMIREKDSEDSRLFFFPNV